MKLIDQSRRAFVFDNPDGWIFENNGIEGTETELRFPRRYPDNPDNPVNHDNRLKWVFTDVDECVKWYEENKMKFAPGKKMIKTFHDIKTKSLSITDQDWELMKKRMRSPEKFSKEDFIVFEDWLANNWRDRDRERFSKGILEAFNRTIPGKQRLMGHDWRGPGYGRYYKSRIEKLSIEEALEFIGEHSVGEMKKHLMNVVERDGGLYVLVPTFYMRMSQSNQDQIADLEAGIGGDSSIGFRADGREPVKDKDGNILYTEYVDNGTSEAMEGSDVWLGSQRGSQIKKDPDDTYECECIECGWKTTTDEHCADIKCEKCGGQMRRADRPGPGQENTETVYIKPSKNEHACDLVSSEGYSQFSNQTREHDGKKYRVLLGIKEGKSKELSYHYNKEIWTATSAKSHCKDHGGKFYPAKTFVAENEKAWTTAYINTLEDNCFAVVEPTGQKDDSGRTMPRNARHLPHHAKGNGASGTGGTVDLPHFRNALARMNQIQAVTDKISMATLRSKAKSHLIAHAKKLNIGDYDSYQGVTMYFNIDSIGYSKELELDEDSLNKLSGEIEAKVAELVNEHAELETQVQQFKDVFGETTAEQFAELKVMAENGKAYKNQLVENTNKFKLLLGLVENKEETVKADKEMIASLPISQIQSLLDQYKKLWEKDHPPAGDLPENTDLEDKDDKKPLEIEVSVNK